LQAFEQYKESERVGLKISPHSTHVCCKDYRVLYISPSYEEIWGQTCESLLKRPTAWVEAIIPEDREHVSVALDNQQQTGKFDEEFRIVRPDQSVRWIHDRVFPIRNAQGEIYRLVGIARDITEQVRLQL